MFLSPPVPKGAWIYGSGTIGVCGSDGLGCAEHSFLLPSLVCSVSLLLLFLWFQAVLLVEVQLNQTSAPARLWGKMQLF